jgi:hypothetical protein
MANQLNAVEQAAADKATHALCVERHNAVLAGLALVEDLRAQMADARKSLLAKCEASLAMPSKTCEGGIESHAVANLVKGGVKRSDTVAMIGKATIRPMAD